MRASHAVILAVVLGLVAPAAHADAQGPRRRALLIGINEYMAVPDLRGARNDVAMIREVLTSRFGFRDQDIAVLEDEAATRAGILEAVERLVRSARPGDVVYLHYSGHGSQTPDRNGDEEDQRDETLIPHDGRTEGVADITDDELGALLDGLEAKRLVVTLDSCHSGTATRGGLFLRTRYVPPDPRLELYASPATRGVVPLAQQDHVLLTGAADDEEALDGPVDGRLQGLFSYALGITLGKAPPDASARRIFAGVEQELERIKAQLGLRSMPSPQLEATARDLSDTLFPEPGEAEEAAGPGPPRVAWLAAEPAGPGRVRLRRGPRLGALPGSVWALYPPDERAFPPGEALAEAIVTEQDGEDALARLEPGDVVVAAGSRAIAVAPAPMADRVAVRIEAADASRADRLRAAIASRLDAVDFVGEDAFARFAVVLAGDTCTVYGADGRYEVATLPAGDADDVSRLAASLATLFARSMTVTELVSLENAASEIALELHAAGAHPDPDDHEPARDDDRSTIVVADTKAPVYRIRRPGEPRTHVNSLQLRVRSSHDCWLTLVDVDSEGGVHLLFPNAFSEAKGFLPGGSIRAGETLSIPDSLESGNRAGFHIDYAPPEGTDTVRAFCTRSRAMARALRGAIRSLDEAAGASAATQRRGIHRVLIASLRPALTRSAARGMVVTPDLPEPPDAEPGPGEPTQAAAEPSPASTGPDWAARSLTLRIVE